jgi:hypothetical protein
MIIWNVLDGELSHSGPLLGPSKFMWAGTSSTNPRLPLVLWGPVTMGHCCQNVRCYCGG